MDVLTQHRSLVGLSYNVVAPSDRLALAAYDQGHSTELSERAMQLLASVTAPDVVHLDYRVEQGSLDRDVIRTFHITVPID